MPEKPKRRKNNKHNKRKNKNQRSDHNKKDSDVKQAGDMESCSVESLNVAEGTATIQHVIDNESLPLINTIESSSNNEIFNTDAIGLSQDLNNNTGNKECDEDCNRTDDSLDGQDCRAYIVESPELPIKSNPKLVSTIKSKSLDNDDAPQIVEVMDHGNSELENLNDKAIIDQKDVLIYEVDTDVEWENTNELPVSKELATGKLSITTIPLNIAQCEQTNSLTPEEEISLRNYLHTLNLATHPNINSVEIKTEIEDIINREIKYRLRKKGLADDIIRLGPPRMLDVIDEEGSSESSMTSRRQSYLSDKKSDIDDLEDDVFEDKVKICSKYCTKSVDRSMSRKKFGRLIPQQCMLVGAKIKEPEALEARGDWTVQTVEKMTGAELVYLTDSSSSTSSVHEMGEEETDENEETDVSIRIITPTIEVTDTENLLKNTFVSPVKEKNERDQMENGNMGIGTSNRNSNKMLNLDESNNIPENENCSLDTNSLDYDPHEIIVLSTNNLKTNLYVKDVDETEDIKLNNKELKFIENKDAAIETNINDLQYLNSNDNYNVELKALKGELNDAISNLIKEVSDSEMTNETSKDSFVRQDSSSSVCSSQCTAKYNPTYSSLNDISNILHDENCENTTDNTDTQMSTVRSHVTDVFECVTGKSSKDNKQCDNNPLALRELCVKQIARFPYGDKILEELASVSERLQNITIGLKSAESGQITKHEKTVPDNMPYYPLPDISSIEKVSLSSKSKDEPPPVQPRNSSLKKSHEDNHWTALPSKTEPVYVCLSPSQKMLMEKTNTVLTKEDASELIETHKKYVDRRGYNEYHMERKAERKIDNDPPVVPFKSQTGSRLLALIRDPSVTYNVHSTMNDHFNKSLRQLHKSSNIENMKSTFEDMNTTKGFFDTFKPIPPPRPKKYSSSFYESDESSDFTDHSFRSMKSEKKFFHYSTGNLSKEIENDVSSIQNMHRYFTDIRDQVNGSNFPRRPSLPKDLCEQQMEYIRQKEKEVEAEIRRLEEEKNKPIVPKRGPRAPLIKDDILKKKHTENYESDNKFSVFNSQVSEKMGNERLNSLFSSSQEELLRDKMFSEYVNQMAERQERKQHKIIKITNSASSNVNKTSKSMSSLDILDSKVNNRIEKEFISKARERWDKLGIKDPETEDEIENSKDVYREPKVIEHKIKVIECGKETDVTNLPTHLQDFVRFTAKDKEQGKGSSGECGSTSASPHVILCAVIILVLAIGKYVMRLIRNK